MKERITDSVLRQTHSAGQLGTEIPVCGQAKGSSFQVKFSKDKEKALLAFGHFQQCEIQRFSSIFRFQVHDVCQMR